MILHSAASQTPGVGLQEGDSLLAPTCTWKLKGTPRFQKNKKESSHPLTRFAQRCAALTAALASRGLTPENSLFGTEGLRMPAQALYTSMTLEVGTDATMCPMALLTAS